MNSVNVTVGSYWADNKCWLLGRVVEVIAVDHERATVRVTRDADLTVRRLRGPHSMRSQLGRTYRIKLDWFRTPDRPRHGGFLPAKGSQDGRDDILMGEKPVEQVQGKPHTELLRLKYAHGWTVRAVATGKVVDFDPRRKGDTRAWRDTAGARHPATRCEAEFPPGLAMRFGMSIEDMGAKCTAHVLVNDGVTACGISVCEPCTSLEANRMMCAKCEAGQCEVVDALISAQRGLDSLLCRDVGT